ncbi:N,N-dimethylformamidase beta subunit family domain-containing protein [Brevibacillus reuszeri]|uniref:N,N-dimethylformamidase beta subunit family domain-containing protein n=1 Tax=Brevibacillus reuszeri TaxID=54915 RepID=UPI0028966EA9|nr:N,N-dimethylformamidase beta subunit family domain-containing protein [Brevibacillus reuszeri]
MKDDQVRMTRRKFLKYAALSSMLFSIGNIPLWHNQWKLDSAAPALALPPREVFPRKPVVVDENKKPGNADWRVTKPAAGAIAGYASSTSVVAGETIRFYISTRTGGIKYRLDVYRLGYYQGKGARLHFTKSDLIGQAQGWWSKTEGRHGLPEPDPKTKLLHLEWKSSYSLKIPEDWVTGLYIVRMTDADGFQSYIPFLIRDEKYEHDFMVQSAVTTWHAYSAWGGYGYYGHYDEKTHEYVDYDTDRKKVAVAISYNRPYEQYHGSGDLYLEYPTVYWLESKGYDIGYVTNIDTHLSRVKWRPKGFISLGHDEYYSRQMRLYVEHLREQGVHLAYLGANNIFWQIRFEDEKGRILSNDEEPRFQICYKYRAIEEDPTQHRKLLTTEWRNLNEPENQLLGQMYDGLVYTGPDWVVSQPKHWLYKGLDVKEGDKVKHLIGWEYDSVKNHIFTPSNLEIIAASPLVNTTGETAVAHTTIYRYWTDAFVFDAGTIYWCFGLSNPWNDERGSVSEIIQGVTANLLDRYIQPT